MRKCEAHVLGFDLSVQSLAWQEQDCAAAACATSALWSALHGTAMLFQHKVFSPVEITTIATEQFPGLRRAFPNRGLTPLQMAAAIRQAGLEPEVTGIGRKATLQATAHAYLRARIPLVLNVAMYDLSQKKHPIPYNGDWDTGHAVTITGFSMGNTRAEPYPGTGLFLRSSHIDKLYVHDDQVGPFARIVFGVPPFVADHSGRRKPVSLAMATSWRGRSGKLGTVVFEPETLIIPVYHKIRVDFHAILELILAKDDRFRRSVGWSDKSNALLEWDIFLTTVNEFKIDIRQQSQISKATRWQILTKAWPRYLWRAVAYVESTRVFELLYDATDVDESHDLLIQMIYYDV